MADLQNLWSPPILDLSVDRYAAFKMWKSRWEDFTVVTELSKKPAEFQCSMLKYAFTEETRKIYDSLTLTEEEKNNCGAILTAMETFARGVINETLERHNFNTRKQEEGENFDDFLTDLKLLSKNCNFCDTCHNGLIRDRIVGGIREKKVKKEITSRTKSNPPKNGGHMPCS